MSNIKEKTSLEETGAFLKEARKTRGRTLASAAKALKVKQSYLAALEEGDLSALPSQAYLPGYIRAYAKWLETELPNAHQQQKIDTKKHLFTRTQHTSLFASSPAFGFVYPNRQQVFLSLIVASLFYIGWQQIYAKPKSDFSEGLSATTKQVEKDLNQHMITPDSNVVLMATTPVSLRIVKPGQSAQELIMLGAGDSYFLEAGTLLYAEEPKYVEVYGDDDNGTFLGMLDQIVAN